MHVRELNNELIDKQESNVDLTADMWQLILSKQYWGNESLRWITRDCKNYLLGQIENIQDATVRQNAMWQALIKESFLGNVFYTMLESTSHGITAGSLKVVATQLNNTKLPFDIEEDTLIKLLRDNSLMRAIKENYPNLYKNIREHGLHTCPHEVRRVSEGSMTWLLRQFAGVSFDFGAGVDVVIPAEPIKTEPSLLELVDPVHSSHSLVDSHGSINSVAREFRR